MLVEGEAPGITRAATGAMASGAVWAPVAAIAQSHAVRWAALVAAGAFGLRRWARWLGDAPPPSPRSCCSRARARWLRRHVEAWLRATGTFDGLLAGLDIEHLGADGCLRASLPATGLLLDGEGLERGAAPTIERPHGPAECPRLCLCVSPGASTSHPRSRTARRRHTSHMSGGQGSRRFGIR